MKTLILALLLAMIPSWSIEVVDEDYMVIINNMERTIICYIYYEDGDFSKRLVKPGSESRLISRHGFVSVECF